MRICLRVIPSSLLSSRTGKPFNLLSILDRVIFWMLNKGHACDYSSSLCLVRASLEPMLFPQRCCIRCCAIRMIVEYLGCAFVFVYRLLPSV